MGIPSNTSPPPRDDDRPSRLTAGLSAAYYITASCLLTTAAKTLFNKHAEQISAPLLLLSQALTTLLLFFLGFLSGKWSPPALPLSYRELRAYLPLFVAYAAMLTTSVVALKLTSLLMYNTLRRTSLLFVVFAQARATQVRPSWYTLVATFLTLSGAVFAGLFDLGYDAVGYGLAFAANVGSALYLVQLKAVRDTLGYTNLEFLFVNTLFIVPLLAGLVFVVPPEEPLVPALLSDPVFALVFATACLLTFFLNHSTYVNTSVNDAVAQTVSAQVKDLILLVISVLLIDNASKRSSGNVAGVLVGFLGSVVYGYGKLQDLSSASSVNSSPPPTPQLDNPQSSAAGRTGFVGHGRAVIAWGKELSLSPASSGLDVSVDSNLSGDEDVGPGSGSVADVEEIALLSSREQS